MLKILQKISEGSTVEGGKIISIPYGRSGLEDIKRLHTIDVVGSVLSTMCVR